jgi:hypothetical protein
VPRGEDVAPRLARGAGDRSGRDLLLQPRLRQGDDPAGRGRPHAQRGRDLRLDGDARRRALRQREGRRQSDGARANLWPDAETEERIRAKIPAGRFATREEVARHSLYLLTPGADYITGDCLVVDGGLSLGAGRMWEPGTKVERPRPASAEAPAE